MVIYTKTGWQSIQRHTLSKSLTRLASKVELFSYSCHNSLISSAAKKNIWLLYTTKRMINRKRALGFKETSHPSAKDLAHFVQCCLLHSALHFLGNIIRWSNVSNDSYKIENISQMQMRITNKLMNGPKMLHSVLSLLS